MTPEIPAFLDRRNKTGEHMSTPLPAAATTKSRTARKDAYTFTIRGKIPLDMTSADSLAAAITAVQGVKGHLPAGAQVEITASMGKI